MRFDVVTLFPEMFADFARLGIIGRAVTEGHIALRFRSPREFGIGKHQAVDDTPYGGGAGMLMRADCLVACFESLDADAPVASDGGRAPAFRVLLSPQGQPLNQALVQELANKPALMLVCGRYEGVDERVVDYIDLEVSLGDFVLSGGEVAAMALIDACARLQSQVLGNPESLCDESHSPSNGGMLAYPQYTRPECFRDVAVPEVLKSGDHAKIAAWRKAQAQTRTRQRRADIWAQGSEESEG